MDAEKVAELRKKRTFKKFTFRGIELDALLDLTNDELMDLVTCRARRRMSRGLKRKPMALIKRLRQEGAPVRPHAREAPARVVLLLRIVQVPAEQRVILHETRQAREKVVSSVERMFKGQISLDKLEAKLLEIAGNRWRQQMVADLRKVMKLNRHNSLFKSGRLNDSLAEHRAIMSALRSRDADLAVTRMREHFQNGLEAAA